MIETTVDPIPLHGDIHHHNIIQNTKDWLAIDPKGLIGDPCYDLANTYGNPMDMETLCLSPKRINMMTNVFVDKLNYSRERILKFSFVHNIISTLWAGGDVNRNARYEIAKLTFTQL